MNIMKVLIACIMGIIIGYILVRISCYLVLGSWEV